MKQINFFVLLMVVGTAQASTIKGSIWENDLSGAENATPANIPKSTPNITFLTPTGPSTPINFASGSLYTIREFLHSGNGSTILTGSNQLGNTLDNTLFNFVGTVSVTNGEKFTAGHDDGLTLVIDGVTVINRPLPTSFARTTETYSGPTGSFPFQLVYGECCGAPGDLEIDLPFQNIPEPSSIILFGAGLGLVVLRMVASRRLLRSCKGSPVGQNTSM